MGLLAGGAAFSQFVITPFLNFPKEVSALLLGATGQQAVNGGAPFDTALVHMFKTDFNAMMKVGFFSVEGLCAGFIIGISAIFSALFIGFMFASWMVGFVLFYLVMAISPLFVATMMLTFTKRFFAGWLAAAVGSSLLLILISVLLSITLKVQQQLVDLVMNAPANADKWGMVGSAIGMCVLTFLGALAAYKVDVKAQGIAGGIYHNTMGYVGNMGNVSWNTMNSALSWAGGMAGGGRSLPAPAPSFGNQGGMAPAGASLSGNMSGGRRP